MGTSCVIARETEKGYESIWCKYDGYPAHVGKLLLNHYKDPNKLNELFNLGALNSLGEFIGKKHNPYKRHTYGVFVRKIRKYFNRPDLDNWTVSFLRDIPDQIFERSIEDYKCKTYNTKKDLLDNCYSNYLYLWKNDNWYIMDTTNKVPKFFLLTESRCLRQQY